MLSSLLRTLPKSSSSSPGAEDIFQSSLGLIFTDDLQNQHGDPGMVVKYNSNGFGVLELEVADPDSEEERTKFAHYLWNAGVLMAELVGGRHAGETKEARRLEVGEEWGIRQFAEGRRWWISEEEEEVWRMQGEKVLELGAGVGLPGIMSALAGAEEVTVSDYPAPAAIQTLSENVSMNVPLPLRSRITVQPHLWGDLISPFALARKGRYTRILAADTLWLASQHLNLARSMEHFLSSEPTSQVFVIAGFHTGRARMGRFFEETVPKTSLEVRDIFEMDADGRRRDWQPNAPEEPIGERKKWLVVAKLKRK